MHQVRRVTSLRGPSAGLPTSRFPACAAHTNSVVGGASNWRSPLHLLAVAVISRITNRRMCTPKERLDRKRTAPASAKPTHGEPQTPKTERGAARCGKCSHRTPPHHRGGTTTHRRFRYGTLRALPTHTDARNDAARPRAATHGAARHGAASHSTTRCREAASGITQSGMAWRGAARSPARHGTERPAPRGLARHTTAGPNRARHGTERAPACEYTFSSHHPTGVHILTDERGRVHIFKKIKCVLVFTQ